MSDNPDQLELRHCGDRFVDRCVFPVLRGGFAGAIAVVAIAVWAINFEAFVNAKGRDGLALALIRLVICDAVPLAILFITLGWLSRGSSSEGLLGSIVDAVFFFRKRPAILTLEDDAGFHLE